MSSADETQRSAPVPRAWIAACALLLLPGLWMRFAALEWMDFGGDEIGILANAYRATREPALHGVPSSIGVPLPNFLSYLLAPVVAATRDPVAVARAIAVLNVGGLVCLFLCLRRCAGALVALAGTALLAAGPSAALFARKIWNPDLLFPCAALLYLLLASLLAAPRPWKTTAALVAYMLLCGFHASAWVLFLPLLAWAVVFRVPLDRRGLLAGIAIVAVLLSPWFAHFWTSDFDDLLAAWLIRKKGNPSPEAFLPALGGHARASVEVGSAAGFLGALDEPSSDLELASTAVSIGWILWTALACAVCAARLPSLALRARRGEPLAVFDRLLALGSLCQVALVLAYALGRMPWRIHFYAVLMPVPTLCAAWLLARALGRRPAALTAVVALVVGAHSVLFARFLDETRSGRLEGGAHYPTPYAAQREGWRAELERAFAEIDDAGASERTRQTRLAARYEQAALVLLQYDGSRDQPPASAEGRVALSSDERGLVVVGSGGRDMLRLPELAREAEGGALLLLEAWAPKRVEGSIFYATREKPLHGPGRAVDFRLERGDNRLVLELPAGTTGSLLVRVPAARWVLRRAEARAPEP